MARKVFFSFHYKPDNWRASQVRNIGNVEGNSPASDNDWETVTKGGDAAIMKWIEYEIEKAWEAGKGLVGIHVNKLKDGDGETSAKGANPFAGFTVDGVPLTQLVTCHTPSGATSKAAYADISDNIESWIEDAITAR